MMDYEQLKIDHVEVDQIGNVMVVHFRGHHISDLLEIEKLGLELYQLIEERVRPKLLLNFSGVEFFSSAAIGKLISLNGKLKGEGEVLKLCNLPPAILEVFEVCKLDTVFDIRKDQDDAMLSFRQ